MMPATPRNLKFKHNFNWIGTGDYAYVDVSTNGGTSWTNLRTFTADNSAEQTINMTAYAGQMIVLRWKYVSTPWAWWWQVDDVRTETIPPAPTPVWSQNFDGATAPAWPTGWAQYTFSGTAAWSNVTSGTNPTTSPHSAPNMPKFNSYSASSGTQALLYQTTSTDLSSGSYAVSLWMNHDTGYSSAGDVIYICYATDGLNFYCDNPILRYGGTGWAQHIVPLGVSSPTVYVGILGQSGYGNNIYIDDVAVIPYAPPVTDVPSLLCDAVPGSLIAGFVTDANTTGGIPGALIVRDLGGSTSAMAATANLPAGFYYMFSGSALPTKPNGPSTRTFTASKAGYGTVEKSLNPIPSALNRVDFALPAGSLSLAGWPFDLRGRLTPDGLPVSEKTRTFSILNSGGLAANVKLSSVQLGSGWIPPLPMDQPGPLTMAPQWVAKQPLSLKDVPLIPRPAKPAPPRLDAGDILASWPTGLALPWGAGTTGATVWASNPGAGGGDDYDYEYTADGTQTGRKVQAVFGGVWAADMTRADANGMLWQINVGGDNCIYEVDPDAGMTGNKICPAWPTSERGLAYDPESDTFFGGGWNDLTIYRFDRSGAIGQQVNTGLSISGLAYNPATQHLFVMENAAPNNVTVLDVANGYAVLGSFSIAGFGDYSGAGLEFGCDGLWAINQTDGKAYLVDAGESYPCGANLPWFTMSPTEGVVPAANGEPGQLNILSEFFPSGVNPAHFGLFRAQVKSTNDTPFALPTIPVYMTKAFWDVPSGYWADVYIHGLAGARVTRGCGLGNYCPEVNLTRAQMAIFLVRGAHGPDFVPPPAIGIFADVPIYDGDTTADFIEQLYNDGYTVGCSVDPLLYCPADLMPREQMAVFLVRLKHGPAFVPPPAVGIFADVPAADVFAPWIEQAYADGITVGCSADPLLYCPKDKVTRAQIAVFLVRVLGIPYLP
jgi:hypothetical protein